MGKLYNGGITTTSNFKFESEAPLDDRLAVETIGDLDSLIKYEGMIVYVQSEHKHYTYINESWAILSDELVKLEAEGWVTELVVRIADPATLVINCGNSTESPIVAIKVDDEFVDFAINRNSSGNITDCRLSLGMPVGTTIKIYHDPDFTGSLEFTVHENQYDDVDIRPFYDILKSVRRINSLTYCCFNICNDVPSSVDLLVFRFGNEVTAKITAPLLGLSVCEAFDGKHIQVHLATLPSDMIQVLTDRPLEDKIYVPYHLLEDAKAKFPEQAKYIDALVPATDYNLAKLEAEGWVTELVVNRADGNYFCLGASFDKTAYNKDTEFVVAIKVNDKLVEAVVDYVDETWIDYILHMDLPVGTIIKIYHNPIVSEHIDLSFMLTYDSGDTEYSGDYPRLDIYKCLKRVRGFWSDVYVSCYSLPSYVESLELNALFAMTATVPASVKSLMLCPGWADDGSVSGSFARFNVHFDELPAEDCEFYVAVEEFPDNKIYVPYHLLEEAKARFPDYATVIDALVPASDIDKIVNSIKNGDTIVGKAVSDQNGNVIDETYLPKYDALFVDIASSNYKASLPKNKLLASSTYVVTLWCNEDSDGITYKTYTGIMTYGGEYDNTYCSLYINKGIQIMPSTDDDDTMDICCVGEETVWELPYGGQLEIRRIL